MSGEGGGPEEPCIVWRAGHDGTGVPGERVNMGDWGKKGPEAAAAGEQHLVFLVAVTWTQHMFTNMFLFPNSPPTSLQPPSGQFWWVSTGTWSRVGHRPGTRVAGTGMLVVFVMVVVVVVVVVGVVSVVVVVSVSGVVLVVAVVVVVSVCEVVDEQQP